ncbi:hypothetical protein J2W80_002647 [Methylorubrum extorquens]|nr:hypothetical protein [Methylorubrum extorquens]MCP1589819.1 hypothetical protein [Methylorubrum extorquens]
MNGGKQGARSGCLADGCAAPASSPTRRSGFARHRPAPDRETVEQHAEKHGGDEQDDGGRPRTRPLRALPGQKSAPADVEQRGAADETATGFWIVGISKRGSSNGCGIHALSPKPNAEMPTAPARTKARLWSHPPPQNRESPALSQDPSCPTAQGRADQKGGCWLLVAEHDFGASRRQSTPTNPSRIGRPPDLRGRLVAALLAFFGVFRLTPCLGALIPHFTDGAPRSTGWWPRASTVFGIVGERS